MQQEMVQHRRQSFLRARMEEDLVMIVGSVMTLEAFVLPPR